MPQNISPEKAHLRATISALTRAVRAGERPADDPELVELRICAELTQRRIDRARAGRGAPPSTTPCWYCGAPLTPDQVGLPCPRCGDDDHGINPQALDRLNELRAERGPRVLGKPADWRTERNQRWHDWYSTAGAIENR
jgi:hypothetical protein